MGADLYIRSVTDKAREQFQPAFDDAVLRRDKAHPTQREALQSEVSRLHAMMYPEEGYFRDSYNGTSLLWALDMSWRDVKLNKDGYIAGNYLLRFRTQVATAQMVDIDADYLRENHCSLEGENTVESWRAYFVEKRQRLLAFLDRAIAEGEPIAASL